MEHWGGAQWVLATLMIMATLLPIGAKCAGISKRDDWLYWYVGQVLVRLGLVGILAWGGFWS
jgi:hypothetical protein